MYHEGRHLTAAIPIRHRSEQFVAALYDRLVKFNWLSGETVDLYQISDRTSSLNDGKCDSMGRLWIGLWKERTYSSTDTLDNIDYGNGSVCSFTGDGIFSKKWKGLSGPNGLSWSPDERKLYHVDSVSNQISAFDFDLASGTLGK